MEKEKKTIILSPSSKILVFAITAIICAIIISGSIMLIQNSKQKSIEKQVQMKINQENKILEDKKAEEAKNNRLYNWCVEDAEEAYWSYVELNGTGKRDDKKGVWATNSVWDRAEKNKQKAIDNCFIQYKK